MHHLTMCGPWLPLGIILAKVRDEGEPRL